MADETVPKLKKHIPRVSVGNDDLVSIRDAGRSLGTLARQVQQDEADHFIITSHGKMVAALVPLHRAATPRVEKLREARQHLLSYLQGESGLDFAEPDTAARRALECLDEALPEGETR